MVILKFNDEKNFDAHFVFVYVESQKSALPNLFNFACAKAAQHMAVLSNGGQCSVMVGNDQKCSIMLGNTLQYSKGICSVLLSSSALLNIISVAQHSWH